MGDWKCPGCETLNEDVHKFCCVCGTKKPETMSVEPETLPPVEKEPTYKEPGVVPEVNGWGPGQVPPQPQPPQPQPPQPPQPHPSQPKPAKKKTGLIVVAIAVALLVIAGVAFAILNRKVNDYETQLDAMRQRKMSTEELIDFAIDKADTAMDEGDYPKAEFYLREKALEVSDEDQDVWVRILALDDTQNAVAQKQKDIDLILLNVKDPQAELQEKVDAFAAEQLESDKDKYLEQIASQSDEDKLRSDFAALMGSQQEYAEFAGGEDAVKWNQTREKMFNEVYAAIDKKGKDYKAFAEDVLMQGLENYPDDVEMKIHLVDIYRDRVNSALNDGDLDKASKICEQIKDIDEDSYKKSKADIDTYTSKLTFMKDLKNYMDKADYEGIRTYIKNNGNKFDKDLCLKDGKLVAKIDGNVLMYDESLHAVYRGECKDGKMQGNGLMVLAYTDSYQTYDGAWKDGLPDGHGTTVWFDSKHKKVTVTGDFKKGYENGNMSITWNDENGTWTGTYTVDMGKLTSGTKDGNVYKYAYVKRTIGNYIYEAWRTTTNQNGFYVLIN